MEIMAQPNHNSDELYRWILRRIDFLLNEAIDMKETCGQHADERLIQRGRIAALRALRTDLTEKRRKG